MWEAIFLDRDGTIVEDAGYIRAPRDIRLIAGAVAAIKRMNDAKIPVIVISNQSGVARGLLTEDDVALCNQELQEHLQKVGAHVDKFYWCPHHPKNDFAPYAMDCECRKPKPGMLKRAALDFGIDLTRSAIVGDKASDIGAGLAVGAKTVLVLTGSGKDEHSSWQEEFKPNFIANDLAHASDFLLAKS